MVGANSLFPVRSPDPFLPLATLQSFTLLALVQEGEEGGTGRVPGGKPRGTQLPENQSAGADVRTGESAADQERKTLE